MENNQVHDEPQDSIRKQVVYEQVDSSSARPAWPIIVVAAILAIALVVFIFTQIN
jgi:uncharacterized integral membrane protein